MTWRTILSRSLPEGGAALLHVDISTGVERATAEHAHYWIIFWWQDLPVGQIETWVQPGQPIDLQLLQAQAVAPAILREAQERGSAPTQRRIPESTLVICTRDRPDALQRCLETLSEQTSRPDQVIVVDNASRDDRTRQVAQSLGAEYVREDRPGLDIARNTGALMAKGEIIAYADDDVVLHPRWLERMLAAFDEGIDAVTGLVLPGSLETAAQLHFERHWGFGKGFRSKDFGNEFFARDGVDGCPAWEVGAGASMAFRAAVFREVGLFDERLDVGAAGCSGDSEYWHRLLSHGRVCRYDPAIVSFHYHRPDEAGLRNQIRSYMSGHAAALLVQYERTGNAGNLRRLFALLPRWFFRRALTKPASGKLLLKDEILGYLQGILFYARERLTGRKTYDYPRRASE